MLPTTYRTPVRTSLPAAAGLFREMDSLRNRLLGEFFGEASYGDRRSWAPVVELAETEDELTLSAELPGLNPDQIEVTIEDGILTLRGEKRHEVTDEEGQTYLRERAYGAFRRSIRLPSSVDDEGITAEYKNGVLTCHLPKSPAARGRTIQVQAAD